MKSDKIVVSVGLPEEEIKELKYLYIVVDSNYEIHYEFNNKGHIILPIHKNEINPFSVIKNLPSNLIRKCISDKKNIVGYYNYGFIILIIILTQGSELWDC